MMPNKESLFKSTRLQRSLIPLLTINLLPSADKGDESRCSAVWRLCTSTCRACIRSDISILCRKLATGNWFYLAEPGFLLNEGPPELPFSKSVVEHFVSPPEAQKLIHRLLRFGRRYKMFYDRTLKWKFRRTFIQQKSRLSKVKQRRSFPPVHRGA